MYKLCERCHFHVPEKNALCNVCGSTAFADLSAQSGQSADVQVQLNALGNRITSAFADYGRDLLECGGKLKSAAIKMKNLVAMPATAQLEDLVPVTNAAASHDDVLSFHKNINFGRRAKALQSTQTMLENHVAAADLQPFVPMLVKPLDPVELENALKADVETLKHNLDELKEWFENYGKADSLLREQATQLKFTDRDRHAA